MMKCCRTLTKKTWDGWWRQEGTGWDGDRWYPSASTNSFSCMLMTTVSSCFCHDCTKHPLREHWLAPSSVKPCVSPHYVSSLLLAVTLWTLKHSQVNASDLTQIILLDGEHSSRYTMRLFSAAAQSKCYSLIIAVIKSIWHLIYKLIHFHSIETCLWFMSATVGTNREVGGNIRPFTELALLS